MTPEEMEQLINEQRQSIEDLTAERDSFKAENEKLRETDKTRAEELRKTKELNFTLARQIDAGPKKTVEEVMAEAFR